MKFCRLLCCSPSFADIFSPHSYFIYASLNFHSFNFKLPLIHMKDNIFHRTLTRHLPTTLLIIKRQVTQTMPQQLHLAILAQFHTQVRTCRGMKQTQLSNTEHTTYNSHISHNPIINVL